MSYIDVPAKVLECFVVSQTGEGAWPFNDETGDPFWQFGSTPRDYRWRLTLTVKPQSHSSHKTRVPRVYNGMDIKVGDYVASTVDGTALKIIRIDSKTDDTLICVVEDVFRYNTFRDAAGVGNGLFAVPGEAMIFEVNETGHPVVDPLPPSGVGSPFYANLMSRFQNLEHLSNFIVHQPDHGFEVGQLISADTTINGFVLTDDDHPMMIGTVSFVNGPDDFTVNPVQKVVDDLDVLAGEVGDILYADRSIAGDLTTTPGTNPVMIKLREFTQTTVRNTILNATSDPSNVLSLNGINVSVGGSGNLASLAAEVNLLTAQHGISADVIPPNTVVQTDPVLLNTTYNEVLLETPCTATINNVSIVFTTTTHGSYRYGDSSLATAEDMAIDINDANVTDLVATVSGGKLILTHVSGGGIAIQNVSADGNGLNFAGTNSASGLATLSVSSGGSYIRMRAVDARAINVANKVGSPLEDFGLFSVENGTKAAALYIEQGIRKASNYVTLDMNGRNALPAIIGDQAYVVNKGDGEWGHYLYTGSGAWTLIASQESAKVDSDTYSAVVTPMNLTTTVGEVSAGSKVTSVTFEVTSPFDGAPSVSVGDDGVQNRLAQDSDVDLTTTGSYVVYPSYIYGGDTTIKVFLSNGGALTGSVKVTITYQ